MIFVGYNSTGSYKLYNPKIKEVLFGRDVYFDEAKSQSEPHAITEIIPRLQLNWEEIDSGKEATQGTLNTEQQIVNNRSRRNKNFPSRLSDYQLYPNNAISGDGDLVQQLALMADAEPINLDEAIVSEV